MSDLIDRQAAITAICEDGTWLESQGCTEITMCERKQRDADILSELPTIDAEPVRHGRWVRITTGGIGIYMCNQCGRQIETDSVQGLVPIRYPYCHCGAKMDGERRTDE